jgi:hypothetical protein
MEEENMRKKNKKQTQSSILLNTKEKKIAAAIASAVLLLLVIIFMIIESNDGKITVKNNTNLQLEYVNTYFVGEEGPITDNIEFNDIAAKGKAFLPQEEINLFGSNSNFEVRFKFENNEELFVDAGVFNDKFNGNIKLTFEEEKDGIIVLKVKASNGLLSSKLIDCNEKYRINLAEGIVEE